MNLQSPVARMALLALRAGRTDPNPRIGR
jgi:hypothetical protein